MKKPIIGITGRIQISHNEDIIGYDRIYSPMDYCDLVSMSGGVPIILPVTIDRNLIRAQVENVDGIIVAGGADIDSLLYGEEPILKQGFVYEDLDTYDIAVIKTAYKLGKPIFGICRGIQIINVAFGGTLYQDLPSQKPDSISHLQSSLRDFGSHTVKIIENTRLFNILGKSCRTNSYHHQAVKDPAPGFKVSALASDGVIEAIEKSDTSYVIAVQWHPEMMAKKHKNMIALLADFIQESAKSAK